MQLLGEKISKVISGANVSNKGLAHDNSFTYCMVTNRVRLLLECRLRLQACSSW